MSYCSLAQSGSPVHSTFTPANPLADIESGGGSSDSTIISASIKHSINASIVGTSTLDSPVRRNVRSASKT